MVHRCSSSSRNQAPLVFWGEMRRRAFICRSSEANQDANGCSHRLPLPQLPVEFAATRTKHNLGKRLGSVHYHVLVFVLAPLLDSVDYHDCARVCLSSSAICA